MARRRVYRRGGRSGIVHHDVHSNWRTSTIWRTCDDVRAISDQMNSARTLEPMAIGREAVVIGREAVVIGREAAGGRTVIHGCIIRDLLLLCDSLSSSRLRLSAPIGGSKLLLASLWRHESGNDLRSGSRLARISRLSVRPQNAGRGHGLRRRRVGSKRPTGVQRLRFGPQSAEKHIGDGAADQSDGSEAHRVQRRAGGREVAGRQLASAQQSRCAPQFTRALSLSCTRHFATRTTVMYRSRQIDRSRLIDR